MKTRKPLHEKIFMIFSILMAAVYVLIGVGIIVVPFGFELMPKEIKIAFGVLLIVYGAFRMFRAYKQSI